MKLVSIVECKNRMAFDFKKYPQLGIFDFFKNS